MNTFEKKLYNQMMQALADNDTATRNMRDMVLDRPVDALRALLFSELSMMRARRHWAKERARKVV